MNRPSKRMSVKSGSDGGGASPAGRPKPNRSSITGRASRAEAVEAGPRRRLGSEPFERVDAELPHADLHANRFA